MFGSVSLKNFRCFEDQSIQLKNRRGSFKKEVYIFGENSSGKTSFLLSFAFLKRITNGFLVNKVFEQRETQEPMFNVSPFVMKSLVCKHLKKHATENMILVYEAHVNCQTFIYRMEFTPQGKLVKESLLKKLNNSENTIFIANHDSLEFGRSMVLNKDIACVEQYYKEHFGNYTMLSILTYLHRKQSGINFKSTLSDFIEYVYNLKVVIEGQMVQNDLYKFKWNTERSVISGYCDLQTKSFIEDGTEMLKRLIIGVFPLIEDLSYEFIPLENKQWEYRIRISEHTSLGTAIMSNAELPNGVLQVLKMSPIFLYAILGHTVIYDEFDMKLHKSPIMYLLENIVPNFEGQSIVSFDSLDTMNHLEPASIYVTNVTNEKFSVRSIEDISPTQPNHNIRLRYEKGVYGPSFPQSRKNLMLMMFEFKELMRQYESEKDL